MGQKRNAYRVLVGNPEGDSHWEDLDVGWRIILKHILVKQNVMVRTGFIWFRVVTTDGLF
jgi:hypothetical protein